MNVQTPRLISSASFFAIARSRMTASSNNQTNASVSNLSSIVHVPHVPTAGAADIDTIASSRAASSIYLSTLHLSSSSSSEETADDPNDTHIYSNIDRRASFTPRAQLLSKSKTRTASKLPIKLNSKPSSGKLKLKRSRRPVTANVTHKCICLSTKVRVRLDQLHAEIKLHSTTIHKLKTKRRASNKKLKKLKVNLDREKQYFHECRANLLTGTIQTFYRMRTIRAFQTWKYQTQTEKTYHTGLLWMKRRVKRYSIRRALSIWRTKTHSYVSDCLLNREEELDESIKQVKRLQQVSSRATSNVLQLQSMLNEIVSSNRKERKELETKALSRLVRKFETILFRRSFKQWQEQIQKLVQHLTTATNAQRSLLKHIMNTWCEWVTESRIFRRRCQNWLNRRQNARTRNFFKQWATVCRNILNQRHAAERQWSQTRRVFLSRAWQRRVYVREQQRWGWHRWRRVILRQKRQHAALENRRRLRQKKQKRTCWTHWRTHVQHVAWCRVMVMHIKRRLSYRLVRYCWSRWIKMKEFHLARRKTKANRIANRIQRHLRTVLHTWHHCSQKVRQARHRHMAAIRHCRTDRVRHTMLRVLQAFRRNVQECHLLVRCERLVQKKRAKHLRTSWKLWAEQTAQSIWFRKRQHFHARRSLRFRLKTRWDTWCRIVHRQRDGRRMEEEADTALYIKQQHVLERLTTRKHYLAKHALEVSCKRYFNVWKTDSLLMEGLEAMNDISGHLKAAGVLRVHLCRFKQYQLTRGWLAWRLCTESKKLVEDHGDSMAIVRLNLIIEIGRNALATWHRNAKRRIKVRRLFLRNRGEHVLNKTSLYRSMQHWKAVNAAIREFSIAKLHSCIDHWSQRLALLGFQQWKEHDVTLKRQQHADLWVERHLDRQDIQTMRYVLYRFKQIVQQGKRRVRFLCSCLVRWKRSSLRAAVLQWTRMTRATQLSEKACQLFCRTTKRNQVLSALAAWASWSRALVGGDALLHKVEKRHVLSRMREWQQWAVSRRRAKRTVLVAMQRRRRTAATYELHRYWRRWWEQVHGGCLEVLEEEHAQEMARKSLNHTKAMAYQQIEHTTLREQHILAVQHHSTTLQTLQQKEKQQRKELEQKHSTTVEILQDKMKQELTKLTNEQQQREEEVLLMKEHSLLQQEQQEQTHYFAMQKMNDERNKERAKSTQQEDESRKKIIQLTTKLEMMADNINQITMDKQEKDSQLASLQYKILNAVEQQEKDSQLCLLKQEEWNTNVLEKEQRHNSAIHILKKEHMQQMTLLETCLSETKQKLKHERGKYEKRLQEKEMNNEATQQIFLKQSNEQHAKELSQLCTAHEEKSAMLELNLQHIQDDFQKKETSANNQHVQLVDAISTEMKEKEMEWKRQETLLVDKLNTKDTSWREENMSKATKMRKEHEKTVSDIYILQEKKQILWISQSHHRRERYLMVTVFYRWNTFAWKRQRARKILKRCGHSVLLRKRRVFFTALRRCTQRSLKMKSVAMMLHQIMQHNAWRKMSRYIYRWKHVTQKDLRQTQQLERILQLYTVERLQKLALMHWRHALAQEEKKDVLSRSAIAKQLLMMFLRVTRRHAILRTWKTWCDCVKLQQETDMRKITSAQTMARVCSRALHRSRNHAWYKWKGLMLVSREADDFEHELELRLQKHSDQFPWSMISRISQSLNLLLPCCNPVSGCAFVGKVLKTRDNKENHQHIFDNDGEEVVEDAGEKEMHVNRRDRRSSGRSRSRSRSSSRLLSNANDAAGIVDVRSQKYGADYKKIDEDCTCYTCQRFSRSYLHHLFRAQRTTCQHLISLHNMHYTCRVIATLCGEDDLLADKIREAFPTQVAPDLSTRLIHPSVLSYQCGSGTCSNDNSSSSDDDPNIQDWMYPLVTPESTPNGNTR